MIPVLFILAGTYEQAVSAVRDATKGMRGTQRWVYVSDERSLFGIRDEAVAIVGTFWQRGDALTLLYQARTAKMYEVEL